MAAPTSYTVIFNFSGFQASNPETPLPGSSVDGEFANVATSITSIIAALAEVRRSDGALANDIVTLDSLADEVTQKFQGQSAYQLAVSQGYVGTELEWITSLDGADGAVGATGTAATVTVGTVTTGAPGSSVSVVNSGSSAAAVFDITIPRGDTGASGDGSGDMVASQYDPGAVAGDAFDMANMSEATNAKVLTSVERTKLSGIATAATANDTDANLKDRANHTGTQLAVTISDFSTAADARITSAVGSTVQAHDPILDGTEESFTSALKTKLDGVASGATANDTDQNLKTEHIIVACSDETTIIDAGTGKTTFRMPHAFTLTAIRASLSVAQASGNIFTVDINKNGSTILSTKLTIDNTEKTSVTAATPPVMSSTAVADDDEISIDVDQIGNGTAQGLKVTLIGYR